MQVPIIENFLLNKQCDVRLSNISLLVLQKSSFCDVMKFQNAELPVVLS